MMNQFGGAIVTILWLQELYYLCIFCFFVGISFVVSENVGKSKT